MSATDFLPRRDVDLLNWSAAFNKKINATPLAFNLTPLLAAQFDAIHILYAQSYTLSAQSLTRTRPNIIAKNTARKALRKLARQYSALIHSTPGITSNQLSILGLTIRRPGSNGSRQTLFPRPSHAPMLIIQKRRSRRVSIRLRDIANPTRLGKPVGVASAMVFSCIAATPPANPREWSLEKLTTRTILTLPLPLALPSHTEFWLAAQWCNPRGQTGPFSAPKSVVAVAGLITIPLAEPYDGPMIPIPA